MTQQRLQSRMDPARSIIEAFGDGDVTKGIAEVKKVTGKHATSIQRWMYPKIKGGTNGIIPIRNFNQLKAASDERGINLPVNAFVPQAAAE